MTYKEARKEIIEDGINLGAGDFVSLEALKVAAEALEKQIPQEPTLTADGYFNGQPIYDIWTCPNCSKCYEVEYEIYKHCPECGQAINWSDTL